MLGIMLGTIAYHVKIDRIVVVAKLELSLKTVLYSRVIDVELVGPIPMVS